MYRCPFCSSLHKSLAKLKCHFIKTHLPLRKCPACGWVSKRSRNDPRKAITAHIYNVVSRPNDYTYEFWQKHTAWAYLYFRYSHGRIRRRERYRLYKKIALEYFSLTHSCQHKHKAKCVEKYQVPEAVCPKCQTRIPLTRSRHIGLGSFSLICPNCSTLLGKDLVSSSLFSRADRWGHLLLSRSRPHSRGLAPSSRPSR